MVHLQLSSLLLGAIVAGFIFAAFAYYFKNRPTNVNIDVKTPIKDIKEKEKSPSSSSPASTSLVDTSDAFLLKEERKKELIRKSRERFAKLNEMMPS